MLTQTAGLTPFIYGMSNCSSPDKLLEILSGFGYEAATMTSIRVQLDLLLTISSTFLATMLVLLEAICIVCSDFLSLSSIRANT